MVRTGKGLPADILLVIGGIHEPGRLADLVASNLGLKVSDAQAILETQDPIARLRLLYDLFRKEKAVQPMQQKIQDQVHEEMTKTQRENDHSASSCGSSTRTKYVRTALKSTGPVLICELFER